MASPCEPCRVAKNKRVDTVSNDCHSQSEQRLPQPECLREADLKNAVIRASRRHAHTLIGRASLRDERLSNRARGVLVRLLSNADGYLMDSTALAKKGKEGRGAIRSALSELRDLGYISTQKYVDKRGRWRTSTLLFEEPHAEVGKSDFDSAGIGVPIVRMAGSKRRNSNKQIKSSSSSSTGWQTPAAARDEKKIKASDLRVPEVMHGCRVWAGTGDRERIAALVTRYGAAAVDAAVGRRLPLPSQIEEMFAAQARREESVRARSAANGRVALNKSTPAERRMAAAADLAALMEAAVEERNHA